MARWCAGTACRLRMDAMQRATWQGAARACGTTATSIRASAASLHQKREGEEEARARAGQRWMQRHARRLPAARGSGRQRWTAGMPPCSTR